MDKLLRTFSWQDWRHHPWRGLAAVVAVMLGVALALAVQLINASALSEFSQAVSAVNGRPDLTLQARSGTLDDAWLDAVARDDQVDTASPVLEWPTAMRVTTGSQVAPVPVRLVGVDALAVSAVSAVSSASSFEQAPSTAVDRTARTINDLRMAHPNPANRPCG